MFRSVFDMLKAGIGPSSSHTMGPMVAAARFLEHLRARSFTTHGLRAMLHGSLAFTGVGHVTDRAVILGLAGFAPDSYDAAVNGSAKCCHFEGSVMWARSHASIRAAALVI